MKRNYEGTPSDRQLRSSPQKNISKAVNGTNEGGITTTAASDRTSSLSPRNLSQSGNGNVGEITTTGEIMIAGAPHTPKQNNRTKETVPHSSPPKQNNRTEETVPHSSSRYEFGLDARVDEGEMTNSQSPPSTPVGLVNDAGINLDTGCGATASKITLETVPMYEVVSVMDTGDQTRLVAKRSYDEVIGGSGAACVGIVDSCVDERNVVQDMNSFSYDDIIGETGTASVGIGNDREDDNDVLTSVNSLLHATNLYPMEISVLTAELRDLTIELLVNHSPSLFSMDPSPVDLLREVVKHKQTFLEISMQFDNVLFFYYANQSVTKSVTDYVEETFTEVGQHLASSFGDRRDLAMSVIQMWCLVDNLQKGAGVVNNYEPTADRSAMVVIHRFDKCVRTYVDRATLQLTAVVGFKTTETTSMADKTSVVVDTKSGPPKKKQNRKTIVTSESHYNDRKIHLCIDGKFYKCNGATESVEGTKTIYKKYFQCLMVRDRADSSKWKPIGQVNHSVMKTDYCNGTLIGVFTVHGDKKYVQYFPGKRQCLCFNPSAANELDRTDTRVRLILVVPSSSWNITSPMLTTMKDCLMGVNKRWWHNQSSCGTNRQYLKELSSHPKLSLARDQATAILSIYMNHFVKMMYPSLMHFKVGALRSRGMESQFNLQGTLHRDYLDDRNSKVPNERPQSIILALDPFVFLYEYELSNQDGMRSLRVDRGEAVLFSSSLRHAGGANADNESDMEWKYRLFAYVVSETTDFPDDATRLNLEE